jgi:hypothetical protein
MFGLKIFVFSNIKTWARLISEFAMTMNSSPGELLSKFGNKLHERSFLRLGASVLWRLRISSETANVTNADRGGILAETVGTDFGYRSTLMD